MPVPVNLSVSDITATSVRLNWVRWTPIQLFLAGEQGAWYDPSDLSTMFQDAAGTIPVTADGDPVGLMLDKSGNGNNASQSVSGSRPVYRTDGTLHWLEFDGVDDSLAVSVIDFTATDKITAVTGIKKQLDSTSIVFETSSDSFNTDGSFSLIAASGSGTNSYRVISRGSNPIFTGSGSFAPAPDTSVVSLITDILNKILKLRRNSTLVESNGGSQGIGNYGNHALYIGSRAGTSFFFTGNLYSLAIRGFETTAQDLDLAEQYTAEKTGVSL